jgi:hypothetical protein
MQICILCMGNIVERLLLLSEGMLMLVLGQTEDILNIFFSIKIQINKVTQKLTNLISSIRWLALDFKSL